MQRRYALALGSIAFALVLARGAVRGENISEVVCEAIIALVLFAAGGAVAGWVADYLLRQDIEARYRQRVAWYRAAIEQHDSPQHSHDRSSQDGLAKPDSV